MPGTLLAVVAVGMTVSVKLELAEVVGVDDAVEQSGTTVSVHVIVPVVITAVGVLAAVVHDGTVTSVQSISAVGVLLAVVDVGTVASTHDGLHTIVIVGVLAAVVHVGVIV